MPILTPSADAGTATSTPHAATKAAGNIPNFILASKVSVNECRILQALSRLPI
jgi:hypothetical protein